MNYDPIIIDRECELNEGDMPDKYDWMDILQDLVYELEDKPSDYAPTEIKVTINKSEWDEIETEGKVYVRKSHPQIRLELK